MNPPHRDPPPPSGTLPAYPAAPTYTAPAGEFAPAAPTRSKTAVVSLGFGVAGLVSLLLGVLFPLVVPSVALRVLLSPLFAGSVYAAVAVALGHVAVNMIRASGGARTGRGLAVAALVLGYIGIGVWLIGTVISFLTIRGRGI